MGTNYYLFRKDKNITEAAEGIQKLSNGYVFNETYYKTFEEVQNNYFRELHIGKSSGGWRFSLCIYPSLGINSLEDWKKEFQQFKIVDEYQREVSISEMLSVILDRRGQLNLNLTPGELCRDFGSGAWYDAKHGLIGHNPITHTCDISVTYDLTEDWDFS